MSTENENIDELEDEVASTDEDLGEDIEVEVEETEPEVEAAEEAPAEEPAEEPVEAAAEPESEEAEFASMPEKIKKRFMREKRLRDEIIQEREQYKTVATQAAQAIQQRDTEMVTLKRQNAQLQKQFAETLDYAYERDITLKATEVRKAREDGNYDAELKAQSELDGLRFQQNQVRQAKATLPDPESIKAPEPAKPAAAPAAPAKKPPSPFAVKWVETNKAWFQNKDFEDQKDFVLTVDRKLINEGYDPQTAEYYQELDRRVDKAFPTLRRKPKTATNSPVAPAGRPGAATAASKKTIKLTSGDLSNMRRFGLDPSNKDHLREYARTKRAAA